MHKDINIGASGCNGGDTGDPVSAAMSGSEASYRSVLAVMAEGVVFQDAAGRIISINPAAERILGRSSAEVLGLSPEVSWQSVQEDGSRFPVEQHPSRVALCTGRPQSDVVMGIRHPDGALVWISINSQPLFAVGESAPYAVLTTFHDITRRRQLEEALREGEAKYRSLFEAVPNPFFYKGCDGRYLGCNTAFERYLGICRDEIVGRTVYDIASKELADRYSAADKSLFDNPGTQVYEAKVRWADGSLRDVILHKATFTRADGSLGGLTGIILDITEHKRAEGALLKSESHLRRVNRAQRTQSAGNEALVRAVGEQELLERMCRVMVEVGGHALAWIGCRAPDGSPAIEPTAWAGMDAGRLKACVSECNSSPVATAIERGSPLVVHDVATDPAYADCREQVLGCGFRSALVLPLMSEGETLGVLCIYSVDAAAFDDDEVTLLGELGNNLAYGIRALRTRVGREEGVRRIQATMEATIQALASTVELRDPYTAGHQRRVAQLAVRIGQELGLTDDRIQGLYLASVVHDVGKIFVPTEILCKPGRLSRIELDLVKNHVEAGYEILRPIDFPWPIAEIVRQHHERLDGSGYPRGLKSHALLLESRILAVADAVEAITTYRPYRPALGVDVALDAIGADRGVLLDGDVVDACVRLFGEKDFAFE